MPSIWKPRERLVHTIAVDFDGVIHDYHKGWHDGTIYGDLVPGAAKALNTLLDKYAVFIHTAREPEQVMPCLKMHGFDVTIDDRCGTCLGIGEGAASPDPDSEHISCKDCKGTGQLMFWQVRDQLLVTNRKLAAAAYIDDRGIRFENWAQALSDLGTVL